ncbi:MAG: ABC transporter permease, partial [Tyzzerella sp.]|nr:ABC transporter permease [Tyzzerella sp.]
MRFGTVKYSVKQGVKNIARNRMFSIASIATMAACIFLFGIFFSIIRNFSHIVEKAEEGVAIVVLFDEEATDERVEKIGKQLSKHEGVLEVKYVSAEEAWEEFQKSYLADNPELAEGFADDNPLANSDNYEVYLESVENQEEVVAFAESLEGVRKVNKSDVVAKTLENFNVLLTYISGAIILILLIVAVFLISNTVSMGITIRREEIAIMKLIGATDYIVRAPFVVEGVVIGLIGAAIPLGILYVLYSEIITYVAENFTFIGGIMQFLPAEVVFNSLIPVGLILG